MIKLNISSSTVSAVLLMAFCLLLIPSCQKTDQTKDPTAVEEQNKESFRHWIEATEKQDYQVWDEVCSEDYTFHFGDRSMGLEEHKHGNNPFAAAFPDLKYVIHSLVAEADRVTARITLKGTHSGEYYGIAPTGKKVQYPLMIEARFKKGKIVEAWGVGNQLILMLQLGMELKPKK